MSFARPAGRTGDTRLGKKDRMTQVTTRISGISRVMVPVSDQDRAIEFYCEKLGFEKIADVPFGDGERWVEVAAPGAAVPIALVRPREAATVQPGTDTRIALATGDVRAAHADLKERGVDVDADVMDMGDPVPPMFWFRDQDGNTLLLVQNP
jgi:catechol 2,3-dioxygenase-like lactoylglutathione lyase family enzyme